MPEYTDSEFSEQFQPLSLAVSRNPAGDFVLTLKWWVLYNSKFSTECWVDVVWDEVDLESQVLSHDERLYLKSWSDLSPEYGEVQAQKVLFSLKTGAAKTHALFYLSLGYQL